jgi:hypothetical protein
MAHDQIFEYIKLKTTDCEQVLPSSGDSSANQMKYCLRGGLRRVNSVRQNLEGGGL